MKKIITLSLIFPILLSTYSCGRNRLKTNEKELFKEMLIQEKEKKEANNTAPEGKSEKTSSSLSGSFRKQEIRSVDPGRPPVVLDIIGTQENSRELKLSDVATSIRYVKLQTPPDTSLLYDHFINQNRLMSEINSDGTQIIFKGIFGLTRFNMLGEYQETIWKNETGMQFKGNSISTNFSDFFGVSSFNSVSLSDGDIYFSIHNGPAGNGMYMKYKPGSNKNISIQSLNEIPGQKSIPGDTIFFTNKSIIDRIDLMFGTGEGNYAGVNRKWNAGRSGSLLVTYNENGDTLCKFTDYERIVNFSHTQIRQAVKFSSYFYNGILTLKQEFNDTVFRLLPPDRLLPVYIIDFGKYKVNYMEGIRPDSDLSEKYILNSLFETANFLFIRYSQNYDGTLNRMKNAVKFYNAYFNKKDGRLYHQTGHSDIPEGLKNDIDGGLSFWPDIITPQGEMMMLASGKMIKDYINSEEFKESPVSKEMRQKQISIASGLKSRDIIILCAR